MVVDDGSEVSSICSCSTRLTWPSGEIALALRVQYGEPDVGVVWAALHVTALPLTVLVPLRLVCVPAPPTAFAARSRPALAALNAP